MFTHLTCRALLACACHCRSGESSPLALPLARKCGLPARTHSALLSRDGNLLWNGTLKEGLFCDDPQLHYGIRPGMASDLPWTRAKTCAQILTKVTMGPLLLWARKTCPHPRPGVYPMSGIMCSQGGHLITGQMAKAFSSAYTPRHLCLPGILASLLKAVQSKKALLPMYLSEGGMASSTRAAQFMKALTLMV